MLLRYFYDKALAQASYMVGCQKCGEAMIVDPARNITPYLAAAKEEGLQIRHVTETHIHADFVSGSRELATATGARLYLSDMGDQDWKYGFVDTNTTLIRDGDEWWVGNVRVQVLATPGHTPEHVIFMITDTAAADEPMGIFTGDFVFVGDVGRPDLLETAAGIANTKVIGAQQQFQSLQRLKNLPDYLQLWTGHGAGSACGKALGAIPSTTLGYERRFNPAFQFQDQQLFVNWLLQGQPEAPRYFAQMKKVNKVGSALLKDVSEPQLLDKSALPDALATGLVIDARSIKDYTNAHLPGTLSIPTGNSFSTYAGWFINYEQPTYLIAWEKDVPPLIDQLRAIGVDNLPGYFTPVVVDANHVTGATLSPAEVEAGWAQGGLHIIDVRNQSEYDEFHVPGAHHIPMGYLPDHLSELPHDKLLVVQCQSGVRSHIAASLLRKNGFIYVSNMKGGIEAWKKANLPVEA